MIKHGVEKNKYDLRDYSHERTFGTVSTNILPAEYNADLGLSFPDQDADGLPNGCTGYTQSEIGQDENGELFDPKYTYDQTLVIENAPPDSPCQVRDSFKSTQIYGLKRKDVDSTTRRGAYFDVNKNGDYFDGARTALHMNRLNHRSISAGSPWFREWLSTDANGALRPPVKYVWDASTPGHNYKICGWTTIQNIPYLLIKPWIGKNYGKGGYALMPRYIFNEVMKISGTFMYLQGNYNPADVKTILPDMFELLADLLRRLKQALYGMAPKTN